jgi:anhydro-N-acetylmuramic acid kinase
LTRPFTPTLRARLHDARRQSVERLTELDFELGRAFGETTLHLMSQAGLGAGDIDLIGSHGQTVSHLPPSAVPYPGTLQIGEAAVIAEITGAPVVSDFRARDIAAGGEGAPLVALVDYLLFRAPGKVRALQNIGGIANVTVVGEGTSSLFAFDTGPGNMPLDAAARVASAGADGFDLGGVRAARGTVDKALVLVLHGHPFFRRPPPRTTGREEFGESWFGPLVAHFTGRADDLCATLTRFVAESIVLAYKDHVFPRATVDEIIVSGGGVHNATLMGHLHKLFAPIPVISSADLGMNPDAKEAVAFAVLANETLFGAPGNVPGATGAVGPRVLGKIVP